MNPARNSQFLREQVLNGWRLGRKAKTIFHLINAVNGSNNQISYSVILKIMIDFICILKFEFI
jgi:hypothetical protein